MYGQYEDMLHMQHRISPERARMSHRNRAAQFAPFAALSGFDKMIGQATADTREKYLAELQRQVLQACEE